MRRSNLPCHHRTDRDQLVGDVRSSEGQLERQQTPHRMADDRVRAQGVPVEKGKHGGGVLVDVVRAVGRERCCAEAG